MNSYTNLELGKLLRKIAAAYTILGENRFKVIAYDNAATSVEHATSEVKDLFDDDQLGTVSGLGPSIQSHLKEIFTTGKSKHFDEILAKVNPAVFPLLEVPGLGPKKAEKLVETLKIDDEKNVIELLEKAAKENKIAPIESFGSKSQSDILENIERYKKGSIKEKRMMIPMADAIADEIINHIKQNQKGRSFIKEISKLGSLRRRAATIGDLDFAASTTDFEKAIDCFVAFPKKVSLIERGPTGASLLLASGRQADLRVAKPDEYGAMLQYFTGSKYHNIRLRDYALKKGWSLNEYGITPVKNQKSDSTGRHKAIKKFASEKDLYGFLGLDYIPPEMREDTGEVDAAIAHKLPKLVELTDIKGDLHLHSNYDLSPSHDYGSDTMESLVPAAKALGYGFASLTEHNPKSDLSENEVVKIMRIRQSKIEHINAQTKSVHLFALLEIDILPSGNLALAESAWEFLDGAVVSVHSVFNLSKEDMTARVLKGLSHPIARILGHPTGRLLEQREGYELDWPQIFALAKKLDKALEINAHPSRLDLSDTLVRAAVNAGVLLSINTDSHTWKDLSNMRYGIDVARRGWTEAKNVINTWPIDRLTKWLNKR